MSSDFSTKDEVILKALSKRFLDKKYIKWRFYKPPEYHKKYVDVGSDPTKGATRKGRKKLKPHAFLYDPFKKAESIINDAIFLDRVDMDLEFGMGTPKFSEIIMILDGSHPYESHTKFTKEEVLREFVFPTQKADGTPLSLDMRWEVLALINDYILENRSPYDLALQIAILGKVSQKKNVSEKEYERIKKNVTEKYQKITFS